MFKETTTHVSAPGRVILLGEHAVNFGEPAIALAVDLRVHCKAQIAGRFKINEEELDTNKHPYMRGAVLQGWTDMDKPLAVELKSDIPEEFGLGHPAASTVACLGAISMLHDHLIFEEVARNAFEVNYEVENGGSPIDTSSATHGGCILTDKKPRENRLWGLSKNDRTWHVHDMDFSDVNLILGFTGIRSPEVDMLAKVGRFYQRNSFARDIIKDIGKISSNGREALMKNDMEALGRLMNQNQKLLVTLGAGHSALEKLTSAVSRYSYGAKLTGAGGGGSIIALVHDPENAIRAIEEADGRALPLPLTRDGLRLEDE